MKKFAFIALVLTVGVTCAFAATLKVPWFVDNAATGVGVPPTGGNDGFLPTLTLVYLSNSTDTVLDCEIEYFSAEGLSLLADQSGNTFSINPFATVAFRPVADDPLTAANPQGQEDATSAAVIPNRPRNLDPKANGSLVITYPGVQGDLGGAIFLYQQGAARSSAFALGHVLQ